MSEVLDKQNLIIRADKVVKLPWWDTRGLMHPMSDEAFINAYCEYVLATTDDHSVKTIRLRAYRFIRNFMAPELQKALTAYRKIHK